MAWIDYLVVTSTEFWDGLSMTTCAASSSRSSPRSPPRPMPHRTRSIEEARQQIEAAGVEIRQLTPEQRQMWIDAMKPVWDEFADEIGQENLDAAMASNQAS